VKIALRICAENYRQTRDGVPQIIEALQRHSVGATFLFSLGPDRTGRAIRYGFSATAMRRATAEKTLSREGFAALCYGTVWPAPDIGNRCAKTMQEAKVAGFEVANHGWSHASWLHQIAEADAAWTTTEMQRAKKKFASIFDFEPTGHAAASWQMNIQSLRMTQRLGYQWASDSRGRHPFVPVWNGELIHCPQLPTTLPTFDELIGTDGHDSDNVHLQLHKLTTVDASAGHVFTVHADLYGGTTKSAFDALLAGWKDQGHQICSIGELNAGLDFAQLPRHELILAPVAGRAGLYLTQGDEFLSQ
jgi:undecaprenyl phosphate-alpha-L-ara4FN deformylase